MKAGEKLGRYLLVSPIGEGGVSRGLRTLDALQLAVALDILQASWISVMISADERLCEVAEGCGCPAVDPANPGVVRL